MYLTFAFHVCIKESFCIFLGTGKLIEEILESKCPMIGKKTRSFSNHWKLTDAEYVKKARAQKQVGHSCPTRILKDGVTKDGVTRTE